MNVHFLSTVCFPTDFFKGFRAYFPDYEDVMMTSASERCCDKQTHFRNKTSVEEQSVQKDNQLLRE